MKEMIETVFEQRMEICRGCPLFSENKKKEGWKTNRPDEHCTDCGCTSSAKNRCLSCQCPQEKWMPVTTQEEYEQIKKETDGGTKD